MDGSATTAFSVRSSKSENNVATKMKAKMNAIPAIPFEGQTELPDPDTFEEEAAREKGFNEAFNMLQLVFSEMKGPMSIKDMVRRATYIDINMGTRKTPRVLNPEGVKAAIKQFIEDKRLVRLDKDILCPPKKIPKFRSLDDTFSTYVSGQQRQQDEDRVNSLPSKIDVIEGAVRALIMLADNNFTMTELAAAWSSIAPKPHIRSLKEIFDAPNGKEAFRRVVQTLCERGYAEPLFSTEAYRKTPKAIKKLSAYRSLDDDWE